MGFDWGSKGFEFGLMWFERVLVDKNRKNLLVVHRSSVAHVAALCACECKRAYLLSPPNHQPPFRLRTTTRTINLKKHFYHLHLDFQHVVLNIVGIITLPYK